MELIKWIDKDFIEIRDTLLFSKYFDTIALERGIDVSFLFNPNLGIDVIIRDDNTVKAIHLYSGNDHNSNRFIDILPFDLVFTNSRMNVLEKLGTPFLSGGGGASLLYQEIPYWDKFKIENYFIHIQYGKATNCIDLVTISSLNE